VALQGLVLELENYRGHGLRKCCTFHVEYRKSPIIIIIIIITTIKPTFDSSARGFKAINTLAFLSF